MALFGKLTAWALLAAGVAILKSLTTDAAAVGGGAAKGTNAVVEQAVAPKPGTTNPLPAIAVPVVPGFQLLSNDCVVFLGGATTVAAARYAYLETLLTRLHPGRKIRFRNMGWEGDTVFRQERPLNFGDLSKNLKDHATTALVLNFGLMESLRGQEGLAEFVRAYDRFLEQLSLVTPRIVLLSPNRLETHGSLASEPVKENENMKLYAAAIRDLAERRGLPFVDLFRVRPSGESEPGAARLTDDGLHLSPYGHWRMAGEIERQLGLAQPGWNVEINAASRKHEATGTVLLKVVISRDSVRFEAFDRVLPGTVFRQDESNLSIWGGRMLKITGLRPGRYVLKIDGQPLYEKSHIFWEKGWLLTHGPEIDQAEEVRELIVEKNAEFFHYWRPQNFAFLHGDLTGQPSSRNHDNPNIRWFPEEMKGFLALISRKESAIAKLAAPRPHAYELVRKE